MSTGGAPVRDNDGVVLFPPAVFAAGIVAGYAIHWFLPIGIVPAAWAGALWAMGVAAVAAGGALMLAAAGLFLRARTTPTHWRPTTKIVATGPYRFTRNPIYVGMALGQAGVAFLGNALWPLLMLVPVLWLIHTQAIAREEAYLEAKFGDEYRAYKARVRRWL